ncbi:MAG: hypothetical protein ABSD45_18025 [Terriglobia bacterium]|jgi:hypothetical protein
MAIDKKLQERREEILQIAPRYGEAVCSGQDAVPQFRLLRRGFRLLFWGNTR